jgi:hypothetical protein
LIARIPQNAATSVGKEAVDFAEHRRKESAGLAAMYGDWEQTFYDKMPVRGKLRRRVEALRRYE